jgi:hypothetical protein
MHSLLGACALQEDDVPTALQHYRLSWDLARDAISQIFAAAGLLRCFTRTGDRPAFDEIVERLLQLTSDGVPEACAEDLVQALNACPPDWPNPKIEQLRSP